MHATTFIASSALALAMGAGCGGISGGPSPGSSPASTSDLVTYQQLTDSVQNSVTNYRATMMASTTATAADCRGVHDAYDAEVRPWVSRMIQMGGAMDRYVNDHGGASVADFSCLSATMMYELDQHRTAACASAELSVDRAETSRHADAMLSYDGHMWDRCDQAMRGENAGSWSWGPMMSGCESWDGHCSGMMHGGCCGAGAGMGMMTPDPSCDL